MIELGVTKIVSAARVLYSSCITKKQKKKRKKKQQQSKLSKKLVLKS